MKNTLLIALLLMAQTGSASLFSKPKPPQGPFPWKQVLTSSGLFGVAGSLYATADVVKFNFHLFAKRWPGADRQYFDPRLSARNKYRDWPADKRAAYPGAKTWLVWTTDFYHLSRFLGNALMAGGLGVMLTIGEKQRFGRILLQSAISWMAFATGAGLAHWYYGMGRE